MSSFPTAFREREERDNCETAIATLSTTAYAFLGMHSAHFHTSSQQQDVLLGCSGAFQVQAVASELVLPAWVGSREAPMPCGCTAPQAVGVGAAPELLSPKPGAPRTQNAAPLTHTNHPCSSCSGDRSLARGCEGSGAGSGLPPFPISGFCSLENPAGGCSGSEHHSIPTQAGCLM